MNNNTVHRILRLNQNRIADLERLHTAVYGKTPADSFFNKKYDTAYTGVEYVGFLAYNQDMLPMAFYGVIPCFMTIKGVKVLTAQSADTMTHPQYRGLGLFTQLAEQTYELCKSLGIGFVFGFPNQNSLPGFVNKLGWRVHDTLARFTIPVKTVPIEKLALKFPLLKPVYDAYKKKLMVNSLVVTNNEIKVKDGLDGLLRDNDYMHYKRYSDSYIISFGNVKVWLKACGSLFIGDIIDADESNFEMVINKLQYLAAKLGLNELHFHCSPGMPVYALFAARYRPEESFPVIFKDLGKGHSYEHIKFTFADIDIF